MEQLAEWWHESISLLTLSAVIVAVGVGFAFGVFAAQFDSVPRRTARVLAGLVALFGSVFFVTLTLTRIFDADYPGTGALRTLGTLFLWWLACGTAAAGDYSARRVETWWVHRRRHRP